MFLGHYGTTLSTVCRGLSCIIMILEGIPAEYGICSLSYDIKPLYGSLPSEERKTWVQNPGKLPAVAFVALVVVE